MSGGPRRKREQLLFLFGNAGGSTGERIGGKHVIMCHGVVLAELDSAQVDRLGAQPMYYSTSRAFLFFFLFLSSLAAFNLRRGGSPAPILDRGILPPPHVPRGLLANIIVHEIGGRVGGGREDLHSNRDGDERRRFVKEIIGGRESV